MFLQADLFFSQLTVVPLNSAVKEWSLTMAENEEINLVAASTNLVCFTTASYNLRICSLYGIQRAVLRIPGPVVSISSKENFVLFAYHTSSPRDKDQCIKLMIVKLEGKYITLIFVMLKCKNYKFAKSDVR